ncbi:MAG: S-adenosylmethionine:tRNA ribosyltransferase-isomerase [Tannerellaceae bacterium]|jgi:S-adenosylmethionine:tRNA ribosyltransferase-isomerase|nr:S-adenosylmethionine:tRNA ribosyltransferase-isomerase [Tannerellaceae bacterium]
MTLRREDISMSDYDYSLPDKCIAKHPLPKRDASRLLIERNGEIADARFRDIACFLPKDTLLVFNNSRVLPARIHFSRETGSIIEIFCLSPVGGNYEVALNNRDRSAWYCLVGNGKRWKNSPLERRFHIGRKEVLLSAFREDADNGSSCIIFSWDNPTLTFGEVLDAIGQLPLPPYLNRNAVPQDNRTYQTIYSRIKGSVAAPTAGLHFTAGIFKNLEIAHIDCEEITLHVGAGTFRPVKGDYITTHHMHAEYFTVTLTALKHLLASIGNIVAVGTTTVRTLESLYYLGVYASAGDFCSSPFNPNLPHVPQWVPYEPTSNRLTATESIQVLINYMTAHRLTSLSATTQIIILPTYHPHITRGLITNFHQPRSTLLLLIAAYTRHWRSLYNHALANGYRFLSYGDACLLLPENNDCDTRPDFNLLSKLPLS